MMLYRVYKIIFIVFSFLMPILSSAQIRIDTIEFQGIKKTDASYLNRFLDSQTNTLLDSTTIQSDVQAFKNLSAISNATFRIDSTAEQTRLVFELEEALTFFPIINFGVIRNNFWFQLGFTDVNWLGQGIQLTTFYQNNDSRHNFSLYTRIPYLKGSRWGGSFSFLKFASVEPLYFNNATVFYNYDNISTGLTGIYELSRQQFIEFGGTYFVENYKKNSRHDNETTPGPDELRQPKSLVKLLHQINKIDYHFFYLSGLYNNINAQTVYSFNDETWFHIVLSDTRYFRRVGKKGNLATRLRLGISTNNDTPFAPFVLDSHVNIRGSGNRIDRGTAVVVLNIEYRHTFFDKKQWAGQVVTFSDFGTWRSPGLGLDNLWDSGSFRHFVGGGARIIYKKAFDAILRIDYGIDVYNFQERGLVLGIGQYF